MSKAEKEALKADEKITKQLEKDKAKVSSVMLGTRDELIEIGR